MHVMRKLFKLTDYRTFKSVNNFYPTNISNFKRKLCSSTIHSAYQNQVSISQHQPNQIQANELVYPIFVTDDHLNCQEISSMPGQYRQGQVRSRELLDDLTRKGLKSVLLFGVNTINNGLKNKKDNIGSIATSKESPVYKAIQMIRREYPKLQILADVCLCSYTDHGHCGILRSDGLIDNNATIKRLAEISLHYAEAGAHLVAPSDMMDGRVKQIKSSLENNGFGNDVGIMSYSAKFNSSFYGPFRNACDSSVSKQHNNRLTDRSTYQLPIGSRKLALKAVERDIQEGADFIIVKPAGFYVDIVRDLKNLVKVPIATYQVSGEYSMICGSSNYSSIGPSGVLDFRSSVFESLMCMKRAGASILITYFVPQILNQLEAKPE